jgi:hypothetical protein
MNGGFCSWTQTTLDETRWKYLQDNPGAEGLMHEMKAGRMPKVANRINIGVEEWVSRQKSLLDDC